MRPHLRGTSPTRHHYPLSRERRRRLGPERIAELLAVAEAANMALLVLEAAARSARDDLESVLRSVDAIDQQKRAAGGAAHALDEAGDRAARHLRTVDRLTEAASRS